MKAATPNRARGIGKVTCLDEAELGGLAAGTDEAMLWNGRSGPLPADAGHDLLDDAIAPRAVEPKRVRSRRPCAL